jgi:hypothetical protein
MRHPSRQRRRCARCATVTLDQLLDQGLALSRDKPILREFFQNLKRGERATSAGCRPRRKRGAAGK